MSETVHYKGKMVKIEPRRMRTIQEIAKDLVDKYGIEESDYWLKYHKGDYIRLLISDRPDYVYHDGSLYHIEYKTTIDIDADIMDIQVNNDGTIDYEVKYYNGGASFQEAIEIALKKNK